MHMKGICNGCKYFPCHEGLYDIFNLPDGRVVGCRWSEESVISGNDYSSQLEGIAEIFQRAEWVNRKENPAMVPGPDFVLNSLKEAGVECPNFQATIGNDKSLEEDK